MPSKRPNLLWRTRKPMHADMQDTCQLQTVIPGDDHKLVWITVARGETHCIERIGAFLSQSRFELFSLHSTEPSNASVTVRRVTDRKPPKRIEQSRRATNETSTTI